MPRTDRECPRGGNPEDTLERRPSGAQTPSTPASGKEVPMQAHKHAQVSVALSATYKGKPRSNDVWVMRSRLPSGQDSREVLGLARTKRGRRAHGHLTEGDALSKVQAFAADRSADTPDARRSFRA